MTRVLRRCSKERRVIHETMHDLHVHIDVYMYTFYSQDGIARRVIVTLHTTYAVMSCTGCLL